ncbi:MAG: hypothetical protein AAF730_14655, partial [Bacteroidota bacterium]
RWASGVSVPALARTATEVLLSTAVRHSNTADRISAEVRLRYHACGGHLPCCSVVKVAPCSPRQCGRRLPR